MRTIRFIISALVAIGALLVVFGLGSLSSAYATEQDNYHPVYPNAWSLDINKPCSKGSDKMFVATLRVKRPYQIGEFGEMYLELMNDKFLVDDNGKRVRGSHRRMVEFSFFPRSRKAQVLVNDLRDSLVFADFPLQAYYSLELRMQCNEKLPDIE